MGKRILLFLIANCIILGNVYCLVDLNATKETKALYHNLISTTKKGVMFGHQDDTLYGIGWKNEVNRSDVKTVCGDYPAVYGWEIGNIELGCSESLDSVSFDILRRNIMEAYGRGGVNTISWHANNPESGKNAWDCNSNTAVMSILPKGINHAKFNSWLDIVANFLTSLKDKNGNQIPILFRPWHEQNGIWFWWGKSHATVREYCDLYRYTVTYLRDKKNVHNLIYVWSPSIYQSKKELLETYPGDKFVDVMGVDWYKLNEKYQDEANSLLNILAKVSTNRKKVMAFTETGYEGIKDKEFWTKQLLPVLNGKPISYVLVWRNAFNIKGHFFAPYPGSSSAEDFIKFKNGGRMLFESDLPNMYK